MQTSGNEINIDDLIIKGSTLNLSMKPFNCTIGTNKLYITMNADDDAIIVWSNNKKLITITPNAVITHVQTIDSQNVSNQYLIKKVFQMDAEIQRLKTIVAKNGLH